MFPLSFWARRTSPSTPSLRFFRPLTLESLETRLTPTAAYDPQSLLIRLEPNALGAYSSQPVALLPGLQLEHAYQIVPGLWRARIVDPTVPVESLLAALNVDPRVAYAVPNGLNQAESLPNDPRFNQQWHLAQPVGPSIRADAAWRSFTGNGINTVAIFDTGLDIAHPDLRSRLWVNAAEIPGDGIDNDGNGIVDDHRGASFFQGILSGSINDGDGHGTAVAGLIGATGNNGIGSVGVNWAATLLPLKVIQGGQALDGDILQAMDYATRAGARIWNLSLGGGGYSRAMSDAFEAATEKGIIVVTAAGNQSQNTDLHPHFPSSYTAENVISVAATDSSDQLARFSNHGIASVDIAAPGTNLLTTLPGGNYGMRQGTSMAAALVTGAVSLLWDKTPAASASQILDTLMNGSRSLPTLKGLVQSGLRLDLGGTIDSIVDARPLPPSSSPLPIPSGNPGSPVRPPIPFLPESTDSSSPVNPWLPSPVQPPQPNRPTPQPGSPPGSTLPSLPPSPAQPIPPGGSPALPPPIANEPGFSGPVIPGVLPGNGSSPPPISHDAIPVFGPTPPALLPPRNGPGAPSPVVPLFPIPFPVFGSPGWGAPSLPLLPPGTPLLPPDAPTPEVDPIPTDEVPPGTEEEEVPPSDSEDTVWENHEEWDKAVLWLEWE